MEAWGKALNFARRAAAFALWSLEFAAERGRLRRRGLAEPVHLRCSEQVQSELASPTS